LKAEWEQLVNSLLGSGEINWHLNDLLATDRARKIISRSWSKRAAVSLLFDSNDINKASVLMIQRAKYEGDPWSGQMAFPGGRQEKTDKNALATAKRETFEEVGFDIDSPRRRQDKAQLLGRLSDINAAQRSIKINLVVTPYVFALSERPQLTANYEVADLVWVPLSVFTDFSRRRRFVFKYGSLAFELPCYHLGKDQVVWGLSLAMVDELLQWSGCELPDIKTLNELDQSAFR